MGGCASRPKGSDLDFLPVENQAGSDQSPKPVEGHAPTQEKVDSGEPQTVENEIEEEEPLVDLSDSKTDAPSSESTVLETPLADLVSEIVVPVPEVQQGPAHEEVVSKQVEKSLLIEVVNPEQPTEKVEAVKETTEETKEKAEEPVGKPVKGPEIVNTETKNVEKEVIAEIKTAARSQ